MLFPALSPSGKKTDMPDVLSSLYTEPGPDNFLDILILIFLSLVVGSEIEIFNRLPLFIS